MNALADLWVLALLAFFLVAPLTLFLPFYMAAKARAIQHALEDIALQIQLSRTKDEKSIFELAGGSSR